MGLKLDFYEYRPDIGQVVDRVWYSCTIPLAGTKTRKDTGRPYVDATITTPPAFSRIPCHGYLVITHITEDDLKAKVSSIVYGGVPTVKSAEIEADVPPPSLVVRAARTGAIASGRIRLGTKGWFVGKPPEEIEADFAGYTASPATPWVQIGKTSDDFAVQVKLVKVAPIDSERSLALGDYYISPPTRVVVNLPGR